MSPPWWRCSPACAWRCVVDLGAKIAQVRERWKRTKAHGVRFKLIDEGVNTVTISKRLGQAKPDITLRIYAHLFKKDDGKAAAAINAALDRQGGNPVTNFGFCSFGTGTKRLISLIWKGGRVV